MAIVNAYISNPHWFSGVGGTRVSWRGYGSAFGAVVNPTVTITGPAAGTTIALTEPLSIRVADEIPSFKRIIIVAYFPESKIKEIVFDGDGFGPMYKNSQNTKTAFSTGFDYTVLRDGGWVANDGPVIIPFVLDTTGGENV